ncbi:MAG: Fic family protein [Myxococcaceae bacterium]
MTEIQSKLSQIDEFKGWWKGTSTLNPQELGRLKRSIVVTSTGASTRIEGSQLSDKDVEKLLKGLKTSKLKDRDSQEVAGYAEVLKTIFDSYKDITFSEGAILQFHNMLLRYSDKDQQQRGRYKSAPNKVVAFDSTGGESVLFNPTEPYLTTTEMRELIEWTKHQLKGKNLHPILVIANFVVEFLAIHPFHDGNGRLSRILTNLLLAKAGYAYMPYVSLEKIIEDHKTEYYIALRTAQKDGKSPNAEMSRWINFFIDVMLRQIDVLKVFLNTTSRDSLLSQNQQQVLSFLGDQKEISTGSVIDKLKLPSSTAKQILNRLLDLKMIQRVGSGRSTRYFKVDSK